MNDRGAALALEVPDAPSEVAGAGRPDGAARAGGPLISIVTANLNDAAGLRVTAKSIARQTWRSYEWLVIDGGSSDRSLEVIAAFEAIVDGWSSAPDRGVYDALNLGLRRARGAYVVFMNAGDAFAEPATLERVASALSERPGVDLLFGGTILDLPSGRRVYRPPRAAATWLPFGLPAYHQATFIRREAHLAVPYDLGLPVSADYGAIATLLRGGASSLRLDAALAIRHCGPDNLSERETAQRFRDFVRVQRCILDRGWGGVAISLGRLVAVHVIYRALRDQRGLPVTRLASRRRSRG